MTCQKCNSEEKIRVEATYKRNPEERRNKKPYGEIQLQKILGAKGIMSQGNKESQTEADTSTEITNDNRRVTANTPAFQWNPPALTSSKT